MNEFWEETIRTKDGQRARLMLTSFSCQRHRFTLQKGRIADQVHLRILGQSTAHTVYSQP